MSDEWPLEIDGDEYHPVPDDWIEQGRDARVGDVRIFAVSVAVGRGMTIRYAHPTSGEVAKFTTGVQDVRDGEVGVEGQIPAQLRRGRWPRSLAPSSDPHDVTRVAETRHLRRLWGDRSDRVHSDEELEDLLRADGGTVGFGDELERLARRRGSWYDVEWVRCERCCGTGERVECYDDLCHAQGRCMHGAANNICNLCGGTGRVTAELDERWFSRETFESVTAPDADLRNQGKLHAVALERHRGGDAG